MFSSVRVRLTVWYTAVMAVVLVVLAIATYVIIRGNSFRRTDASVMELAESFLLTVKAEAADASEGNGLKESVAAAISEHRFRETHFIVLDQNNEIVGSSWDNPQEGKVTNVPEQIIHESVQRASPGESTFRTVRWAGRSNRSYVRRFSVRGRECTLVVLQSLHRQEEFLESAAGTFGLVIPLALFLAAGGGYFLAKRSLSPVVAMSAQAGRIGAENLHDRLKVQNPTDELGRLASSFNELLDRLDRSFEQQRRFVADASHELRTPVAILCGEADVALSQPVRAPEEYRESLNILRAEARRLKHVVEDLFTLARADAGQHPLTLTDFYLEELVSDCVRNMRALASAKNITLSCTPQKDMLVRADEGLLRRMLMNLLDNAIKYTGSGGSVSVSCVTNESGYSVNIRDTGEGIPAELQSRIFERFFRVDQARSRSESDGGGAGLGLAISRWIVEAHGGRIELTRSTRDGSEFTIHLPATTVSPLIPHLSANR